MLPTSLFILPDGHADRCPGRKNLTHRYWVGSLGRLPTGVHVLRLDSHRERRSQREKHLFEEVFDLESSAKVFRNSSPCLKAGVSLR